MVLFELFFVGIASLALVIPALALTVSILKGVKNASKC